MSEEKCTTLVDHCIPCDTQLSDSIWWQCDGEAPSRTPALTLSLRPYPSSLSPPPHPLQVPPKTFNACVNGGVHMENAHNHKLPRRGL